MADKSLPVPFRRVNKTLPFVDSVFSSLVDLNAHLANPTKYAGQVATLDEAGEVTVYVLNSAEDAWVPVGSGGGGGVIAPLVADSAYVVCKGTLGGALANLGAVTFIDTLDPEDLWTTYNIFTAPSDGMYTINFAIEIGNFISAIWNHRVDGVQGQLITSLTQRKHSFTTNIWLNEGQTWELQYTGAATTTVNNGNNSYMTIAKIPNYDDATVIVDMEIGDLSNVDTATTAPVNGDTLAYNGVSWVPAVSSGGSGGSIPASDKQKITNALLEASTVTWLGDSITENVNGYVRHVESKFSGTFTNRAVGGHTSKDLVSIQLAPSVADNAEAYIIAVGLNDIRYFDVRGEVTIAGYLTNIKIAVDALKATTNSPTIACINIFPTYWEDQFSSLKRNEQLITTREWNNALQAFCNQEGILYIDMFTPIFNEVNAHNFNQLYNDSVHPSSSTFTPQDDTGALLYASAFFGDKAHSTADELVPVGKHFFKLVMHDHETPASGGYIGLRNISIDVEEDIGLTRNTAYNTNNLFGPTDPTANFYNWPEDFPFNVLFSTDTYPADGVAVTCLYTGAGVSRGVKSFSTYYSKDPAAFSDLEHSSWSLVAEELSNDGLAVNILPSSRKGFYYRFQTFDVPASTLNMKKIGTTVTPIRVSNQNLTLAGKAPNWVEFFGSTLTNSADGITGLKSGGYIITFESPYELTELDIEAFDTLGDYTIALSFDQQALSDYVHPSWEEVGTGSGNGIVTLKRTSGLVQSYNTGILVGGVTAIGTPTSTISITAGEGIIVDSHTDATSPVVTPIIWSAFTNVVLDDISAFYTSFAIDINGDLIQRPNGVFSRVERRDLIALGTAVHLGHTEIEYISHAAYLSYGGLHSVQDLGAAIGTINVAGNVYQAASNDLSLEKTAGDTFALGSNYHNSTKDPNVLNHPVESPLTFNYNYRDGFGGFTLVPNATLVVQNKYDTGGGILATVPNKEWTVQRVFYLPQSELTVIQYGQEKYKDITKATAGMVTEEFVKNPALEDALLRGFIVIKGDCTDLSDEDCTRFVEADKFGQSPAGGAGSSDGDSLHFNGTRAEIDALTKIEGNYYYATDEGEYYGWDGIELILLSATSGGATEYHVARPLAVSPIDGNTAAVPPMFESNVFESFPEYLDHDNSTWEIADDIGFTNIIVSAPNDLVNLTTYQSVDGISEVVDVTLDMQMDVGSYELTFGGEVTTIIPADTITDIQTKLNALTFIDTVSVTGDATSAYTITFVGNQAKKTLPFNILLGTNLAFAVVSAERQQITLGNTPNAGVYTMTVDGSTTVDIDFDDDIATIDSKITALASVGGVGGTVNLTGTPQDYVIEFGGTLNGDNIPLITFPTNTLSYNVSEVQTVVLDVTPNSGMYNLTYSGQVANIQHDDDLTDIASALTALSTIGGAGITVNVVGTPSAYTVTLIGIPPEADRLELIFANFDAVQNISEVQSISLSGTPTSGSYTLGFNGGVSASINYNDSVATVAGKINAIAQMVTAGGVTLTGSTTNMTATFNSFGDFPQISVNSQGLNSSNVVFNRTAGSNMDVRIGNYASAANALFADMSSFGGAGILSVTSYGGYNCADLVPNNFLGNYIGWYKFSPPANIIAGDSVQVWAGISSATANWSLQISNPSIGAGSIIHYNSTAPVGVGTPISFTHTGDTIVGNSAGGAGIVPYYQFDFFSPNFGPFCLVHRVQVTRNATITVTTGTSINGSSTLLLATVTTLVDGSTDPTSLTALNLSNGAQVPVVIVPTISILGMTNGNLDAGTYYWRVKYSADNGTESTYSDGASFIVI